MTPSAYTWAVYYASLPGKLLAAVLIPTVLGFLGFSFLSHLSAQRALEVELGRRLSAIAAAASVQVPRESLLLLQPGDEGSRTYRNLKRRLVDLARATSAERIYVVTENLTGLVDTADTEVVIGERYYTLDISKAELRSVFAGAQASSVLFQGRDGRLYKSGFAPVLAKDDEGGSPTPRFAVAVDGSAGLYQDLLAHRRTLFGLSALNILFMVALALLFGRRLSRPLLQLTESARTIETGVLSEPVPPRILSGGDEVAVLAQGLEAMRKGLKARDERLQMMLAGIAHEVRNPLGGMELFSGLLRDELSGEPMDLDAARSYVTRVEKEIGHLKAVVSDFLEYARRPPPHLSNVDLLALVNEISESIRAAQADVAVEVVPGTSGVQAIWADPEQLRRALLNLGHNAAQACSKQGGVVRFVLQPWEGGVRLSVCDNGPGIPKDVLPKIWTPFFTTRQKGTGLGLAFVREILDDHKAQVEIDTGPSGTTFHITLRGSVDGEHPDHR